MENEDRNGRGAALMLLYCLVDLLAWLLIIVVKATDHTSRSWIFCLTSILWLPFVTMAVILVIWGASRLARHLIRKLQEAHRRRKIARTLWEAMEGLTLNSVGPIYGVKRQPGEKNAPYKRRILKAAQTVDTVNIGRAPDAPAGKGGKP